MTNFTKKYQTAIIGLGRQALEDHIPACLQSDDINLVAVVEKDKKRLNDFLKEYKKIKGYNSMEQLLKNNKLDFVIITAPHFIHYELTKKALDKNIHVLKEKPFAISLKEAKKLANIAKKKKLIIGTTLQRRFNPIYSTFTQFIDKIGHPFYIDIKYTFYTEDPYSGWRGKKELAGGGCLLDMGYHVTDLLMWYFDMPNKIFAEFSSSAKENIFYNAEDTAQVLFKYDNKELWGSMLISRVIPPKQEYFHVYGTRGIIKLERGKIELYKSNGEIHESLKRDYAWPSAAQDQLEYFVKVISGKKKNISNPNFHFKHLAFIEAAYESNQTKKYTNPKKFI
jgi:predicted dehydrogenase